jgi:hypothetical protein
VGNRVSVKHQIEGFEEPATIDFTLSEVVAWKRNICDIAKEIQKEWLNASPHARPYLNAMLSLKTIDSKFGSDNAKSIVLYFLTNSSTWRGEAARRIKAELKEILK